MAWARSGQVDSHGILSLWSEALVSVLTESTSCENLRRDHLHYIKALKTFVLQMSLVTTFHGDDGYHSYLGGGSGDRFCTHLTACASSGDLESIAAPSVGTYHLTNTCSLLR